MKMTFDMNFAKTISLLIASFAFITALTSCSDVVRPTVVLSVKVHPTEIEKVVKIVEDFAAVNNFKRRVLGTEKREPGSNFIWIYYAESNNLHISLMEHTDRKTFNIAFYSTASSNKWKKYYEDLNKKLVEHWETKSDIRGNHSKKLDLWIAKIWHGL